MKELLLGAVMLSSMSCESSTGARLRDAGPEGGDAGDADAAADADAAGGCVTERFLGVDGCDVIGSSYPCEGRNHVPEGTAITWVASPPHSGAHHPTIEPAWGEHAEVVPRGTWVANLEVGGVVLLHDCPTRCEPELDVLRAVIEQRPEAHILMTPDPELPAGHRFAAVSWTWVWSTDEIDEAELTCFVDEHQGYAPEELP